MEVGSDTEKQRLFGNVKDTTQEAEKHNRKQSRSANPFRRGRRVLQSQQEFVCERLETDFVQTFGPKEKQPEPDMDGFRDQKLGPKKRPESQQGETTRT